MPKNLFLPREDQALQGRSDVMPVAPRHVVLGTPMQGPFPAHLRQLVVGMGCFWGAERMFWQQAGVTTTAVGYAGGHTQNPSYQEVCSGHTGHTEVVLVVYDPANISLASLLQLFWESHDPTQGMRQHNDVGTQYRSALYFNDDDTKVTALASRDAYDAALKRAGLGAVTTELRMAPPFYYAEDHHQQYLHKNPHGYCGLAGTGVSCAVSATSRT